MADLIRIAASQMDVAFSDPVANRAAMSQALATASSQGARLTIFPECSLAGYCFESREEARPWAETVPGPSCEELSAVCRRLDAFAVVGLLERDGDRLFNACVLLGPGGLVGSYRKIHLPYLGVDRFTDPGDRPFAVYEAGGLRVGLGICYDSAFPESARVMALEGADLIALPTNFPSGAECMLSHVIHARAMENKIDFASVNRIGTERGFRFIGQSKICDPNGHVLAEAPPAESAIIYADVDVEQSRTKRVIRVPGKHIIDRFADRRPEMYGRVTQPK